MSKVYLIQDIPGTTKGEPKYNILGAQKYGDIVTLLPEFSQMILSPGPLIRHILQEMIIQALLFDCFEQRENLFFRLIYNKCIFYLLCNFYFFLNFDAIC